MAWGRGLLRLWIVLSVFWAVAMAAFLRTDETIINYQTAKSALGDRTGIYSYDDLMRASQNAADAGDLVSSAELAEVAAIAAETTDGNWRSPEYYEFESTMDDLKFEAAVILVPILISFFIGAALLWAIRGFRDDTT